MCTVSYIPASDNSSFALTSNRAEKVFRPTLPPVVTWHNGTKLAFPRDEKAGGSWIAINEDGRVCCPIQWGRIIFKLPTSKVCRT
ncbi:MAG: NRDE family protein [Cyclobacteriaceae bacterium]|nr:NRDE family protein [Cyclobacteriaceae bacterium]